ncbi:MAG: hypothetical protein GY772_10185, partial [bacterium]|nr:hypothetical protein [bacterium]
WLALAGAVRILIDDQNRTTLPPTNSEEFTFLFNELEGRISEVLHTAIPYWRMKKAETASEDMELQRTMANVFGVMEGSSAGAGGRSVAITSGVPPESGASSSSSTQAGPTIQQMLRTCHALGSPTPTAAQAKAAAASKAAIVKKAAPAVKLTPAKKSTAASAASGASASSSSAAPPKAQAKSQRWSQRSWQGWNAQAWNPNTPRSWWEE